jgi:hypothetical protein
MVRGFCFFVLDTAMIFSRHVAVSSVRLTAHGFPKARDNKRLFDHRVDRFNHRLDRYDHHLSEICSAFGSVNTLADWSTSESDTGTVANSHSYSRACIKSNTHSYRDSEPDTVTNRSTRANASPTSRSPSIVVHRVRLTPTGVRQECQLKFARIFTRWSLRLLFSTRQ